MPSTPAEIRAKFDSISFGMSQKEVECLLGAQLAWQRIPGTNTHNSWYIQIPEDPLALFMAPPQPHPEFVAGAIQITYDNQTVVRMSLAFDPR